MASLLASGIPSNDHVINDKTGCDARRLYLRIQHTVLRACDEDETFNLEEVAEFCRVRLAHGDRIRLFVGLLDDIAQMSDEGKIVGYSSL